LGKKELNLRKNLILVKGEDDSYYVDTRVFKFSRKMSWIYQQKAGKEKKEEGV
jgi:hypothetical protein